MKPHRIPKSLYHFLFLLLLAGLSLPVLAARISGRVTDAAGQPIPFAGVLVQGATEGTSANADGFYVLQLPKGNYRLLARQMGYEQQVFALNVGDQSEISHNFVLQEQGYQLKDIVIRAGDEDPAYRIMRQVIKRRSFHLSQLESFQTGIYVKGVMRNRDVPDQFMGYKIKDEDKADMGSGIGLDSAGRGVLYLCEEFADYYASGKKKAVLIRSVKESGNPNGVGLGNVPAVINFYENNVRILSNQYFISPVSANALMYYKYRLVGDFAENGQTIYRIKVTPKRAYERCFSGELYIADEDWAIHSLDLLLTKTSGLDMFDTARVEQLYVPLKKDLWVIKNQLLYPTLNLLGFDISGSFVTVYDRQQVNMPIPDSVFDKKIVVRYDQDAKKKDSLYWTAHRLMDLEHDESRNYVFQDSVYKRETDTALLDSARRRANRVSVVELLSLGSSFTWKGNRDQLHLSPIMTDVNFNIVEGLNYAPSLTWTHRMKSAASLTARNDLRYGFGNTHFNARTRISYRKPDLKHSGKYWELALGAGKYISQLNTAQPVPEAFNTFSSLLQRKSYFNIFERWMVNLVWTKDHANGLSWSAGASWQRRMPLYNTTDYSWLSDSKGDPYKPNMPEDLAGMGMSEHEVLLLKASISYSPGYTYTAFPDKLVPHKGKWPVFTLSYQKGMPELLNSGADFDKWRFSVKDNLYMKLAGVLEYNVAAGGFLNDKSVQVPDMMHLLGNQYVVATSYTDGFQLAPYYRFSNTEKIYAEAHVTYYLKGLLSNKIPLLRQALWYFVVGNNTFYANTDRYYTEAFVGIDNLGYKIFRGLRVDYAMGWDSQKRQYSGVRIGLHMSGMSQLNKSQLVDF